MRANIPTLTALALLSLTTPTLARTTSQFREFFPAWNGYLLDIIDTSCTPERDAYHDPSNNKNMLPYKLANCLLDGMEEFRKTEMGITAVILGLLPTILQRIGPTVAEVTVLASRRPLLAVMLGVAMPSVATGGGLANPAEALRRRVDTPISGVLGRTRWLWVLISAVEYLIASAAIANLFHLLYQLAYLSVSVSAIAINAGALSQTYTLFLWVLLLVPAYLLGFWALKMRYKPSEQVGSPEEEVVERKSWVHAVRNEFVPCAVGEPLLLTKVDKGPLSVLVQFLTEMASFLIFVFGTVALSSQIFISLGDVVPIVVRFISSTLVCRAVLLFELYGLREVTSRSTKEAAGLVRDGYGLVSGQDSKSGLGDDGRVA